VRGHLVRRRLALGGPGVLRRSGLANDEDLVTMNEMTRIPPFDYVGFTENGKTWGFEFSTLFAWSVRSEAPLNPYTKVPLSSETRKRMFRMWVDRVRHHQLPGALSFSETCCFLAQIFQDNGFADVGARSFLEVSKTTWIRFFRTLQQELLAMLPETSLLRRRGILTCRRMEHFFHTLGSAVFCQIAVTNLLRLMTIPTEPYLFCFSVLSCFFRC